MRGIDENNRKWWILGAMGAILGLILLDETVVGVALPTMQIDLDMSEVTSHWVVNIYMLVLAGLAAVAGKAGDIVGHKVVMITGLIIFGLASLACGLAESDVWLITARGVQGVGAATIFPSSLAMTTIVFPEQQRGLALGIYGAIGTTFLAIGPLVGGFLTDFASWRWIFWINPPIVLTVALVVFMSWVETPETSHGERLDKAGLVLLVSSLSMVVFALMEAPDWGWGEPSIVFLLIGGLVLFALFLLVELRIRSPLIAVGLFTGPTFSGCNLVIFAAQYTKMAILVFGAMYLQDFLGMTPLMAGVALLPTVAPQVVTAPLAGKTADRFGARWPSILGVLAMGAGLAIVTVGTYRGSYGVMFPGLLLWGLSMAFVFVAPQRAVMNSVLPQKRGEAGGIAMSSQLLGATIGMAVCSTLYSMTSSIDVVMSGATIFTLVVLVISWLTIETSDRPSAVPEPQA